MKVEILHNGRALHQVHRNNRDYVVAPPEGAYSIRLTNTSYQRQMAVVSVDGVNVITNEAASYKGSGYILSPGQVVTIPGWRRTATEVAGFTFGGKEQSYTAQTGRGTKNSGMIGVAIFNEKKPSIVFVPLSCPVKPWYPETPFPPPDYIYRGTVTSAEATRRATFDCASEEREIKCSGGLYDDCYASSADSPIASAGMSQSTSQATKGFASSDLGTGYGSATTFNTTSVGFESETEQPVEVIELFYATRKKLVEMGVIGEEADSAPKAFPAEKVACPAPSGWKG